MNYGQLVDICIITLPKCTLSKCLIHNIQTLHRLVAILSIHHTQPVNVMLRLYKNHLDVDTFVCVINIPILSRHHGPLHHYLFMHLKLVCCFTLVVWTLATEPSWYFCNQDSCVHVSQSMITT